MPPILVLSSAKRVATQMFVIEKLNEIKKLFWVALFVISSAPTRNYLNKNKVRKLFTIKNEGNGVVTVSLLLTMNILQTFSNCWLWTDERLQGSYWKDKHF